MVSVLASLAVGAVLTGAAAMKAADPLGASVALSTYGLPPWRALVWALVLVEAVVGLAALAGLSRWPAVALLGAFALAQGAALAAGRGGAPCGCAGGRGRLTRWSLTRTVGLLGIATAAGEAVVAPVIVASVAAFAGVVLALRSRPAGALDISDEGPEIGAVLDVSALTPAERGKPRTPPGQRVLLFTSEGCSLCSKLRGAKLALPLVELDERRDAAAWAAANVPGSPYAVVLDGGNRVRAKGTPNTLRQLQNLIAAARIDPLNRAVDGAPLNAAVDAVPAQPQGPQSRRTFLARTAAAAGAVAAGGSVKPGDAEAFHFCGHIYTTDGCPHPTGLPRIDSKGFPLRAKDGHRVDDLGRLVDLQGRPVDEAGAFLLDADGQRLPPATRTRVCSAAADTFGLTTRTDGAWYRCCGGHVRKLVDCCSTSPRRINGDASLRGYCYGKRRVFCVMYYQTRVPC